MTMRYPCGHFETRRNKCEICTLKAKVKELEEWKRIALQTSLLDLVPLKVLGVVIDAKPHHVGEAKSVKVLFPRETTLYIQTETP